MRARLSPAILLSAFAACAGAALFFFTGAGPVSQKPGKGAVEENVISHAPAKSLPLTSEKDAIMEPVPAEGDFVREIRPRERVEVSRPAVNPSETPVIAVGAGPGHQAMEAAPVQVPREIISPGSAASGRTGGRQRLRPVTGQPIGFAVIPQAIEFEVPEGARVPVVLADRPTQAAGEEGSKVRADLLDSLSAQFVEEISQVQRESGRVGGDPSEYLQKWRAAVERSDEKFRALFGQEEYMKWSIRNHLQNFDWAVQNAVVQ